MTAIQRFKNALIKFQIDDLTQVDIFKEFENISDQSKKERKPPFLYMLSTIWMKIFLKNSVTKFVMPVPAPPVDGG